MCIFQHRDETSSRDPSPVASTTEPIALVPARMNYPLGYPGYRGEMDTQDFRCCLILILEIFKDSSFHIWSS